MFFTDTNIPIGYTVVHDKWHEVSKEFIEDHEDSLFWSNLVQDEYGKKLEKIVDEVTTFLEACDDFLVENQKDFVNYYEFENFILKRTKNCELDNHKKRKLLEEFWKKYDFGEGISEIVSSNFSVFIKDFEKLYFKRDSNLNQIMQLHDCGLDNFKKYLNYANKLFEWGVHPPDCKIITDAHDYGLKHSPPIFVSNDDKMIEKIINHDTPFLKILEFKSLN